jgi:hypothetical protein
VPGGGILTIKENDRLLWRLGIQVLLIIRTAVNASG